MADALGSKAQDCIALQRSNLVISFHQEAPLPSFPVPFDHKGPSCWSRRRRQSGDEHQSYTRPCGTLARSSAGSQLHRSSENGSDRQFSTKLEEHEEIALRIIVKYFCLMAGKNSIGGGCALNH
jgi:hypothetical protein